MTVHEGNLHVAIYMKFAFWQTVPSSVCPFLKVCAILANIMYELAGRFRRMIEKVTKAYCLHRKTNETEVLATRVNTQNNFKCKLPRCQVIID